MQEPLQNVLIPALQAAFNAGLSIMEVYRSKVFRTKLKEDLSPVTEADHAAHGVIADRLGGTSIPMLSEEGKEVPFLTRCAWESYWLIDPLDGTKEFIRGRDEFTVNIALIEGQVPVLGIIYAPCLDIMYFSLDRKGAFRVKDYSRADRLFQTPEELFGRAEKLPVKHSRKHYTAVASRSHRNEETDIFIRGLRKEHPGLRLVSTGSSLKFCLMAEGKADIYPRFGRTMEWDTAAGHAIARATGCSVIVHGSKDELLYNKEDLANPWFIVHRTP